MAIEESIEQDILEARFERERREHAAEQEEKQQKHEERIAKIQFVEQGRVKARTRRIEAAERVLMGVLKLVPLLLALPLITLLLLARREVPNFLRDFVSI